MGSRVCFHPGESGAYMTVFSCASVDCTKAPYRACHVYRLLNGSTHPTRATPPCTPLFLPQLSRKMQFSLASHAHCLSTHPPPPPPISELRTFMLSTTLRFVRVGPGLFVLSDRFAYISRKRKARMKVRKDRRNECQAGCRVSWTRIA